MTEDKTLKKSYLILQKEFEKEVPLGSTVKITKTAKDGELGWGNVWPCGCEDFEKELIITAYSSGGIGLSNSHFYPFFVLEVIRKHEPLEKAQSITQKFERCLECSNENTKATIYITLKNFTVSSLQIVAFTALYSIGSARNVLMERSMISIQH